MIVASSSRNCFYVGENYSQSNLRSIIFINGILHSDKSARSSALSIADKIRETVVVFWNQTLHTATNQSDLVNELTQLISIEHNRCNANIQLGQQIRIILVAHSHGAYLTYQALSQLEIEPLKERIEVVAVGPAKILSLKCARRVQNFINEQDLISLSGQVDTSNSDNLLLMGLQAIHDTLGDNGIVLVEHDPLASVAVQLALKVFHGELIGKDFTASLTDLIYEMFIKYKGEFENKDPSFTCMFIMGYVIYALCCKINYPVTITIPDHNSEGVDPQDFLSITSEAVAHDFSFYLNKTVEFIDF